MENTITPSEQFALTLKKIKACSEALEWAEGKDYATAWDTCSNSEWMFFLINKIASLPEMVNEQLVCRFAREVVHLTDDPRVLACIETREAWIRGEVSDEVRAAALSAAWDAARSAARWAAGDVAVAARDTMLAVSWYAAWAAAGSAARYTARAAAGAAARLTAGQAARYAARSAARATVSVVQCGIIRELVPRPLLDSNLLVF